MAIGVTTRKTKIASKVETVEKTFAPATLATDFFSPIEYPGITQERETKERNQITSDIGIQKSLQGQRSSGITFAQEFRGSGTPGTEPEWGKHAKAILGKVDNRTTSATTAGTPTTTVIEFSSADLIKFKTNDALLFQDSVNEFSVRFVKFQGNTIVIGASNKFLDMSEGGGDEAISVVEATYQSPDDLAKAIQSAINANTTLSADYTVTYAEATSKFTIAKSTGNFELAWNTGTNTANTIGGTIGFSVVADDTGSGSYTSDNQVHDDLTITPALANAPASGVTVSGASTYKRINEGHDSMSFSIFQGDEITTKLKGCKGVTMGIGNLSIGDIPQLNFGFQGLSFDAEVDGGTVLIPDFQDEQPPLALGVDFLIDGTSVSLNSVSMEAAQTVTKITDMTNVDGSIFQIASRFEVTGSMDPWADDTSVDFFTKFDASTDFEIMVVAGRKDSSGDLIPGSIVAVLLPQVVITENTWEDADGVLRRAIGFRAHRGVSGELDEIAVAAL